VCSDVLITLHDDYDDDAGAGGGGGGDDDDGHVDGVRLRL
jgi:hypothetical protein